MKKPTSILVQKDPRTSGSAPPVNNSGQKQTILPQLPAPTLNSSLSANPNHGHSRYPVHANLDKIHNQPFVEDYNPLVNQPNYKSGNIQGQNSSLEKLKSQQTQQAKKVSQDSRQSRQSKQSKRSSEKTGMQSSLQRFQQTQKKVFRQNDSQSHDDLENNEFIEPKKS